MILGTLICYSFSAIHLVFALEIIYLVQKQNFSKNVRIRRVRNIGFSEKFVYSLNGCSLKYFTPAASTSGVKI